MWFGGLTLRIQNYPASGPSPFGGHATLGDGLVSYWKLDEANSTRFDSVVATGNDLTDNNTVASAAGIQGDAASFVAANNESLTSATLAVTGLPEFTVAQWIKLPASATNGEVTFVEWNFNSTFKYACHISRPAFSNSIRVYAHTQDGSPADMQSSVSYPDDLAWHLVIAWYDGAYHISLDGGTPGTASVSEAIYTGANRLEVGAAGWTQQIDEVGVWSRVLTAQERTDLYNSGVGLTY